MQDNALGYEKKIYIALLIKCKNNIYFIFSSSLISMFEVYFIMCTLHSTGVHIEVALNIKPQSPCSGPGWMGLVQGAHAGGLELNLQA